MSIPTTKTRVGVVGAGKMGELHIRKYLELAEVTLVGIFEPSSQTAHRLKEKYGVTCFDSYAELLFEADAVSIASPTETHFACARQAFEAGVHVLLEKPISKTVAEGESLVQMARERKLIFQIGFLERFRYQALTGSLPRSPIRFVESDRLTKTLSRESSIDVVSDLMIHDLDLALALVPEDPSWVSGVGVPVVTPLVDMANARLEFPSGAVVNLNASRVSDKPLRKFRVFSTTYYASVDLIANTAELFFRDADQKIVRTFYEQPELDALRLQCEQFIRCVQTGQQPLVSGSDGVRALKMAKLVRQKIAERGGWAQAPEVTLDQPSSSILFSEERIV